MFCVAFMGLEAHGALLAQPDIDNWQHRGRIDDRTGVNGLAIVLEHDHTAMQGA